MTDKKYHERGCGSSMYSPILGRFMDCDCKLSQTPSYEDLYKGLKVAEGALEQAKQAFIEVKAARENGPAWFTKGVSGQQSHIEMWLRKGCATTLETLSHIKPLLKEE